MNPEDPVKPFTPDYAAPETPPTTLGCLILAIGFAVVGGGFWAILTVAMAAENFWGHAVLLGMMPVVLTLIAWKTHHRRRNIAVAIVLITFLTYLLMVGLCSSL